MTSSNANQFRKQLKLLWDPAVINVLTKLLYPIIEDPKDVQRQDLDYKTIERDTKDCTVALDILYGIGFKQYTQNKTKRLKIEVDDNILSHMKHIYNQLTSELYDRSRVYRHTFDCKELMKSHPPKFSDGAKQLIFKKICPNAHDNCFGTMIYSRYKLTPLPSTIPDPTYFVEHKLKIQSNIFEYKSNTSDPNTFHFYVNFADRNLFGFYRGSLFAQDEIMTTEHPILGSLREKLVQSYHATKDKNKLIPKCEGAIIILNALKHGHFSQENLATIYGKKFRKVSNEQILQCVEVCEPPIVDNIICIAALMGIGRQKVYKKAEIQQLLRTAYCGFNGAKGGVWSESLQRAQTDAKEEKEATVDDHEKKIVIHTGNWGCGAFGGNIQLHCMLQIVAAVAAGVDEIIYHSVDDKSMTQAIEGCKVLLHEIYPKCKHADGTMKRDVFLNELMKKEFHWGTPNGT